MSLGLLIFLLICIEYIIYIHVRVLLNIGHDIHVEHTLTQSRRIMFLLNFVLLFILVYKNMLTFLALNHKSNTNLKESKHIHVLNHNISIHIENIFGYINNLLVLQDT